jgi:hypothetical protein
MKTAVEWLEKSLITDDKAVNYNLFVFNQAKKIEKEENLKHQLFIGKVSELIGFEKTIELLKQVNEEIK